MGWNVYFLIGSTPVGSVPRFSSEPLVSLTEQISFSFNYSPAQNSPSLLNHGTEAHIDILVQAACRMFVT